MAIKDIFTMIKADRYTQDGREELIKAQEAVTEDVTYKPGDISRKTGLQKQPDGSWAPVKNAPAQSKKKDASGSAPSELKIQGMSKEEYIPWRMKTYKENEAQASSVWNHFAEQQKNKGKENEYDPDFHPLRDSAPRVLTGDCKVRIKKSK
jgi:hypothetical protein